MTWECMLSCLSMPTPRYLARSGQLMSRWYSLRLVSGLGRKNHVAMVFSGANRKPCVDAVVDIMAIADWSRCRCFAVNTVNN